MRLGREAEQLAEFVVNYSVDIKPGNRLLVSFDPAYRGYADLLARKARDAGAEVRFDTSTHDPSKLRELIRNYNPKEWAREFARRRELFEWCNASIYIDCESDPGYVDGIENPAKMMALFERDVSGPADDILYRAGEDVDFAVKWNLVAFPTTERARAAGMTFEDYETLLYNATLGPDWEKMRAEMERVKLALDGAKDVHIYVPGLTDLNVSLADRGGEINAGHYNMPDGELAYGPVEESPTGRVYFQCPTNREGLGTVRGISLKFIDGKVTQFSAEENQAALEAAINTDEGARRVGELGIGFNYGIKRPTLDTLFDEKMGGTIHLALGDSYRTQPLARGGGLNASMIHWDIVCDLRRDEGRTKEFPGGEVRVDGVLVHKNGKWTV
jgi:aminopeptidase